MAQSFFLDEVDSLEFTELDRLIPSAPTLIRIDGNSGVGKTKIALKLCCLRSAFHIDVDSYINPNINGNYFDKIDIDVLRSDIERNLSSKGQVVVSGMWLEALLSGAMFFGFRIYVISDVSGAGFYDEQHRQRKLGTDIYRSRFDPVSQADLVINRPGR